MYNYKVMSVNICSKEEPGSQVVSSGVDPVWAGETVVKIIRLTGRKLLGLNCFVSRQYAIHKCRL